MLQTNIWTISWFSRSELGLKYVYALCSLTRHLSTCFYIINSLYRSLGEFHSRLSMCTRYENDTLLYPGVWLVLSNDICSSQLSKCMSPSVGNNGLYIMYIMLDDDAVTSTTSYHTVWCNYTSGVPLWQDHLCNNFRSLCVHP